MRFVRNWAVLTLSVCCLMAPATMVQAKTVYVSQATGANTNDGLTWETAKATVTAGVNTAGSGNEVWVAKGTYVERITVTSTVGLYGGFAGNEATRDQRNWKTNATILDDNKLGTVVTLSAAGAILDGFVVRNGRSDQAGGVFAGPSTVVSNNLITGNVSTGSGGGVYCDRAKVVCNTIRGNSANRGGGVYCNSSTTPSAEVAGNVIMDNSSATGAGVTAARNSFVSNNTIIGNCGTGIACISSILPPTVSNNIVAFNAAGIVATAGSPVLRNNCIYNPDGDNYSAVTPGTGDLNVDPKMAGFQHGDFHIQPDSPCRDAGWNDAPSLPVLDIDGQPRIQPTDGTVDIGADESDGTPWPTDAVVVRVSLEGDDADDGSSWALAKKTVQAGIDVAATTGGEVWVASGTYHERIALKLGSYVYGGFAGTEDSRDSREWRTNVTVLDGDLLGSVVNVSLGGYRRSAIDGFTIQHGTASNGGGIYCGYSGPTIANNKITDNTASASGGGMYCPNSSPLVVGNTIVGNTANNGSGVFCDGNTAPRILNNVISSNPVLSTATEAAAVCLGSPYQLLTNNTILGHSGYGVSCPTGSLAVISNNIVAFNLAGISITGTSTTVKNNCLFNQAYNEYASGSLFPGDVLADPKIVGWRSGNFHIQPDSPCRDAGANDAPGLPSDDLDGQPRIQPTGGKVDIGADESDGTAWTVDAAIVRVSPDGNDSNDGSSWPLAKKTVQAGIDAAAASNGEVWVKAGVYGERVIPNSTSPLPFGMPSYVYLYGGFSGVETARSARDWNANTTILDGGGAGSVVTTVNNGNSLGTVDGFTIRNGSATNGGGIMCDGRTQIANNTITGNSATSDGGGICCSQAPFSYRVVPIINNRIVGNSATNGGGIACLSQAVRLSGNTIAENTAATGAGLYHNQGNLGPPPSIVANNAFVSNHGSGIDLVDSAPYVTKSSVTVTNNTIINNEKCGIEAVGDLLLPVSNNIIAFNQTGFYVNYPSNKIITSRNNCFYNPGGRNSYLVPLGEGDIQADPKLADGWMYDYRVHIQPDSPCRDTGWNDAPEVPGVDIDGQPRIQPNGGRIDIGADESDGTTWTWEPSSLIVRVSLTGNDANDGSSWTLAKRTVQAGIDSATPIGGNVWVAAGTYLERISLGRHVNLFGGFVGTENALSERPAFPRHSPDPAETILDGQKQGSVVTFMHVGGDCGIDGFTATNGTGDLHANACNDFCATDGPVPCGGGILCDLSSPVIANNTVTGNNASYGAGIYLSNSSALITNNRIADNVQPSSRGFGGGLYACVGAPVIRQNTISDNSSSLDGAGMCLWRCTGAVLDSNQITGNNSVYNGGGLTAVYSHQTITRNIFAGNTATNVGGGIDLGLGGTTTATDNIVRDNKANNAAGVWMDGNTYQGVTQFGILTVNLVNNTIAYNDGEGIRCIGGAKGFMANNIVAFNTSGLSNGSSANTVRNNDIFPSDAALPDNISADPLFVSRISGNYHLTAASPCINAGWNDAPGLPLSDMDGQKRIQGPTVDIGADEWWPGPADAKRLATGSIGLSAVAVSAAFADFFYIESDDRSAGIRIDKPGHAIIAGMRVDVDGAPGTNAGGEHVITAGPVTENGVGSVTPIAMNNKTLGGGQFGYQQPSWQWLWVNDPADAITDYRQRIVTPDGQIFKECWRPSTGLNNIGLLIRTWGRVTYSGEGFFYIDDGSALDDDSGHKGVKVYGSVPVASGVDPVGKYVIVTGISSCEKLEADPIRIVRTRGTGDVSLARE